MVLKKTLESPLDFKIKPVNLKRYQTWIFTERTDAEAEALILGHLMWKADSLKKTLIVGKGWSQKKGAAEYEMIRYHHQLSGHEFEQTLGDSEGQEAWHTVVHVVTNNWTQFSDWTTTTTAKSKDALGYKQLASECLFNVLKGRMTF